MFIDWRCFPYSEAPEERNRFCLNRQGLPCFAPNGARSLGVRRSYKHLAPLERNRIQLLNF